MDGKVEFVYNYAVVRAIPDSFIQALRSADPGSPVSPQVARQQHADYVRALQQIVYNVQELPADEAYPDCVFVEDTAVIVGSRVVISRPGAPERRGEELAVEQHLAGLGPLQIHRLKEPATLDGGDVLVADHTIWVGLSTRTNMAAVEALREIFADTPYVVEGFHVAEGLHLKSSATALSGNCILVAENPAGHDLTFQVQQVFPNRFEFLFIPDPVAANVVRANDGVIIQAGYPRSEAIIRQACERLGITRILPVDLSETMKVDGSATCSCLLLKI